MVEQIHGVTNEGKWNTYGFYGYWAKDWTILDPNFGTKAKSKELVEKTHAKGIRVVLDAVVNYTGPVTEIDKMYPNSYGFILSFQLIGNVFQVAVLKAFDEN